MSTATARARVAMVVEQLWQPVPGGSGTYVTELSRRLPAHVDLVSVSAWHRAPADAERAPGGRLRRVPLPRRALYELWQRSPVPRLEWSTGPVDLVHATTWAVPATRLPLVVTVHDLAFLADPGHFTAHGAAFFRRALSAVCERAAAVVVPSASTARECLAEGIEVERVHVVPHGNALDPASPADVEQLRRRHGLTRPYVLWVGTHEPRKNLGVVGEAFRRLRPERPDLDLVLVGPTGWGDVPLPSGDDVHVLGRLSRSELAAAYAGATVFCFPSLREGFGLPVLEAMAAGVPVVTSAGTACAEVLGDAGLAVPPTDPDAVAAALVEAAGARAAELSAASLARAAEFSWERAAEATAAVYRGVLDG